MLQAQFRAIRARSRPKRENQHFTPTAFAKFFQSTRFFVNIHNNMFEISVRRIFEIPHRSLQLFFAFFWRNFRKDYSRTNRARSRQNRKKKEKFLKNWDISKTKRAMIIIFLIIKTSDFFWISDKKIVSKKYFLASVESLFSN